MKISANEVVLCATNEGELYKRHLQMARENAATWEWRNHIADRFMPIYRRHTPDASIGRSDMNEAATKLRAYYVEHLKEF